MDVEAGRYRTFESPATLREHLGSLRDQELLLKRQPEEWLTVEDGPWTIRLTAAAEADFGSIIGWTIEQFGDKQALAYSDTIIAALEALKRGAHHGGSEEAPRDRKKGLFTLHVSRGNRRGRRCRSVS